MVDRATTKRAAGPRPPGPSTEPTARQPDQLLGLRESVIGGVAAGALTVAIWAGSLRLTTFDSALVGYAVAIVALTFAVVARYARWLRMPSTRRYWRRGWQQFATWPNFRRLPGLLPRALFSQLLGQGFIRRRGLARWIGHQCLFWGVIGATLITFPLVFGWLRFLLEPGTGNRYRMWVFGFPTVTFDTTTFLGWSVFRALAYTSVLVIIGCAIFLWRRFRDRAVIAGQRLGYDMVPLLGLLAIAITGLMLTASATFLAGAYYGFLVIVHMATVVLTLVFIPYGKFFHVVQRPASVGIQLYSEVGRHAGVASCTRCGEDVGSELFVGDLQATLADLGQDYRMDVDAAPDHLNRLCPRCKRVTRARGYYAANGLGF